MSSLAFAPSSFLSSGVSARTSTSASASAAAPSTSGTRMCAPATPQPNLAEPSTVRNLSVFRRTQGREGYTAPELVSDLGAVAVAPRAGADDFAPAAIRAVLANAHVYEHEEDALVPIVARYETTGDVRELVRDVAMSESFTKRFLEGNSKTRFVEICFKLLLGRGPSCQPEVSEKIQLLADPSVSYADYIDSFVGCQEYDEKFGSTLLPTPDAPGGLYPNGMIGFMSNMKVAVTTRGGCTDATSVSSLSQGVVAAGESAASSYVSAAYPVKQYEGFSIEKVKSALDKEYYSSSLTTSPAVSSWAGLGTERPHGPETGEWKSGWKPEAKGSWKAGWKPESKVTWKAGWAPSVGKKYV